MSIVIRLIILVFQGLWLGLKYLFMGLFVTVKGFINVVFVKSVKGIKGLVERGKQKKADKSKVEKIQL